uniref:Probable protein-export membrane protein SecG n=1 Tax=Sheathia arcuata TaxID=340433 RepID=A0A3G1I947_9FLOR|nr:SecG superfamily-like protein [Sheathia arcuata]ART65467.1 SecG superfamily-like protein [Sheathia arcuata]
MKIIWYISAILTIIFILIYNPKLEKLNNLGFPEKVFNNTTQTNKTLEILTWSNLTFFFMYIVLINAYK